MAGEPAKRFALAFAGVTVAAFLILLLEPNPLHAARVFTERTFGFQLDRNSPFSIWDWGQYHAKGIPDLHIVQQVLEGHHHAHRVGGYPPSLAPAMAAS